MIKLVITSGYRWKYFQWFLLGFYELEKKGEIKVKFKLPIGSKMLAIFSGKYLIKIADKIRRTFERDSYNMDGYLIFDDGSRKTFTIDSADAPYLFDNKKLNTCNVYFKMQCPIDLEEDSFSLTKSIFIPWLDHAHCNPELKTLTARGKRKLCEDFRKNVQKIKPLMIGPRALSEKNFSRISLYNGYENYLKAQKLEKSGKIMCYFGNALGPKADYKTMVPDYDWEPDILAYFGNQISHPNEKRARVASYISKLKDCDARVISDMNSDGEQIKNTDLIIPLTEFCEHISNFNYNMNVSGYRMSIPNRFIESFMVGTAIITDKLHVRWYKSFESEVYETVEMGYLPMENVNWQQFMKDIHSIAYANPQQVINKFDEKWAPDVVASYIIESIKAS